MLVFWFAIVKDQWVRPVAEAYADQFVGAIELLHAERPPHLKATGTDAIMASVLALPAMNDQDFRAHLVEQLAFLDASAASYDNGIEPEAKRMAATIRLLVHDGRPPARSLLGHLEVRDRLPWTDTIAGKMREAALTLGAGLCITSMQVDNSGTAHYVAPLGHLPPERIHPGQAFIDWWRDTVLVDGDGVSHSRKSLVLSIANTDGGTHVDATLPPHYRALSRENAIGLTARQGKEPSSTELGFAIETSSEGLRQTRADGEPVSNSLALAHVRQIAWELRDTIRRHLVLEATVPYVRASICSLSIHEDVRPESGGLCPCGSGRPFDRCFGQRRPRRTFSIYEQAEREAQRVE